MWDILRPLAYVLPHRKTFIYVGAKAERTGTQTFIYVSAKAELEQKLLFMLVLKQNWGTKKEKNDTNKDANMII